jgi:hypothetical protein
LCLSLLTISFVIIGDLVGGCVRRHPFFLGFLSQETIQLCM